MSNIDKQRISAVRTLEAMGYVFRDEWIAPPCLTTPAMAEADAMRTCRRVSQDRVKFLLDQAKTDSSTK